MSSSVSGRPAGGRSLRLQILGPLRLWRGDVELDPGPRQQAALLAVLLARADQPIGRTELIDLIWDDEAPVSALNVIHKYVGALRRVLEPDLSARGTGSYVQRRGDGYLFESRDSGLDLISFRGHVKAARAAVAEQRHQVALDGLVEALALWRGSAGDGVGLGLRAAPVFVALNGEFFTACVAAADLAVRLGQPERVLSALQLAASMAPLDEDVHAALVTSMGAAGRRAEALATLRAVRIRLADELGIDPGPALRAALQRVLAETSAADADGGTVDEAATGLIGRADELDVLGSALGSAFAGRTGVVVVDGEPGVGKTHLLREMTARADRRGALVVWGMCLEGAGTPSMWPWVKIVEAILDGLPVEERADRLAGELGGLVEPPRDYDALSAPPDSGARFRLFEQVVALVGRAAARRPVVLVVDDLQWADVASLQLFGHMSARLPSGGVVVGALRDRAPTPGTELSRCLATVSRAPGHHRIHLGPMGEAELTDLVRRETGDEPDAGAIRSIHARTAGNPFFVRELSRLLADTGAMTVASTGGPGVPSTVRDVVRSRTTDLGDDVRWLLRTAALVGREVGISLLAHAAAIEVQACLDRLEPLEALGVLEPAPGDPFSLRFPHDLVRESVAVDMPPRQANELHLRIADALEAGNAADDSVTERLAYHLSAAGPLADSSRTAGALVRAAHRAASKSAFEAAQRQLRSAIHVARTAGLAEVELSAAALLATVFWRQSGFGGSYTDLLTRAEHLARGLGQQARAADFLFMRAIVAFSHHHPETDLLVRRLVEYGDESADPTSRAYARHIKGMHVWKQGDVSTALRHMSEDDWTAIEDARWRQENPLRRDRRMLAPLFRALIVTMHGDVDAARELLNTVEDVVGDDPYAISVWAHWASHTAQWAGDPAWGLRITDRWRTADPYHSFVNIDTYLRVSRCWARALTGDDPAGSATEAEQLIGTMRDPPMYGVTQYYSALAEMWLAAGMANEAGVALDDADRFADRHDERYTECLRLLLRAKVLHARGEPVGAVRAAAAEAEIVSIERGAYIIARRAGELMTS
ncbi:BTAD domain-containing putative transcriptional regulator [Actinomadura sp. DC4]|uniref:ATP-binding protein n=1 Tax=Actinomadura sp. DC4 TaxID=3055069 RepID=UPI0025B24CA2|nr:BTAD domain-containing putative transcriptional regulator [Actinomadura sp. DC4]MDN3357317.1 BTAD domain-containing putative transcriptional regulator [Actinomadura sp. DC4]